MPTGNTSEISTFKGQERRLRSERIGPMALLLSTLAASAPLLGVVVLPNTFAVMGIVGLPLLFVILGVLLALFSIGYAEMSRHVHNAGAFTAYVARGLGGTTGAGASVVALVAYSAVQFAVFGIFGFEVSGLFAEYLEVTIAWWIPALAGVALVGILGWLKIDLNAKVLGVLMLIEVVMVLVFDAATIIDPSEQGLSMRSFSPEALTGTGLGTALSFCLATFIGFEQSPVYAEETRRPQVVVARVTLVAAVCVAVFFAVSSWAVSVAVGPSEIVSASREQGPGLVFSLSEARLGPAFTDALHLFYITGMFACLLSFHNVVARYVFSMGREGLLPAVFGRTNRTSGAPAYGSLLQTAVSLIVVAAFAISDDRPAGDPTVPVLQLFTWMANLGALGLTLLLAITSVAVIAFFVRHGAARSQIWRIVSSAVSGLALAVIFVYAVKDIDVLLGTGSDSALIWILPGIIGAVAVLGVGYGLFLRATRPEVYARIGLGNEAFQLEKSAAASTVDSTTSV